MVSVIIPNYNHSSFLQQRIESVLKQTFVDFELIILDDCSTDNSIEIINNYKNYPQITSVIFNKVNSGNTFKQWQKGVALAKGELIWIAESDDFANDNFLLTAVTNFKKNPDAGLFFCDYNIVDEYGVIKNQPWNYREEFIKYFENHSTMSGKFFFEKYMYSDNWIVNASAVVFKKDIFLSCGNAYTQYKLVGDWRIWADICLQCNIIFCNQKLNFFRTHSNSVRSKTLDIFTKEVTSIYKYFITVTRNKKIKSDLKNRICDLWLQKNRSKKNTKPEFGLLKYLVATDPLFFFRAGKKIIKTNYRRLKALKFSGLN